MKKIACLLTLILTCFFNSFSQEQVDSIQVVTPINSDVPTNIIATIKPSEPNFVLYPTSNMYNFIKLDTRSGEMRMVQWSTESKKEFEYTLSRRKLAYTDTPGRFKLHPTDNQWTFLLLDTVDGSVYHVQWSFDEDERIVKFIW